jgi:hypothetical protein
VTGSGPPKCKTCGKVEWRHLCGGVPEIVGVAQGIEPRISNPVAAGSIPAANANPKIADIAHPVERGASNSEAASSSLAVRSKPKTDRKEYLKLKARERRARQRASKKAETE